jgi:glycosyltransferase involved in cell wall biosynthesis
VPRLLLLTPAELTRDPRARRQVAAAHAGGLEVVGLSGQVSGEPPVPLDGIAVHRVGRGRVTSGIADAGLSEARTSAAGLRELRGLYRLARLALRTARLWGAGRRLGRFDVVHANDFDTLPAAALLARPSRARLVYDAHELYTAFESRPPRLYRAVSGAIEGALARRADAVTVVSEPLGDELEHRFRLPRPPLVVLNCPPRHILEPDESAADGTLRAVYQGWIGPGRELEDLFEAVRLAPSAELTLRLVRVDPELLRREIAARGLDGRVHVVEPVPPDRLVEALRGFDVGLIIDRPITRNSELSFPNRLFDYLMAGLAVVSSRLPGLTAFLERERVGVTFEPGRAEQLAAALEELAADRGRLAELRARARQRALERYNAEVQSEALAAAWGLDTTLRWRA